VALDFPVDLHGHWGGSSALYVLVWVSGSRRGRWLPHLDGGAGVLPGLLRLDHGLLRGAGGGSLLRNGLLCDGLLRRSLGDGLLGGLGDLFRGLGRLLRSLLRGGGLPGGDDLAGDGHLLGRDLLRRGLAGLAAGGDAATGGGGLGGGVGLGLLALRAGVGHGLLGRLLGIAAHLLGGGLGLLRGVGGLLLRRGGLRAGG